MYYDDILHARTPLSATFLRWDCRVGQFDCAFFDEFGLQQLIDALLLNFLQVSDQIGTGQSRGTDGLLQSGEQLPLAPFN